MHPASSAVPNRPRVLVVDADADLRGLIDHWLRPQGIETLAAPGPAGSAAVDLVIADLPFPSRALVDSLRTDLDMHGHAPILVLSSTVFASVDCRGPAARALGVDGLLPKPTSGDALRHAVRALIRA